MKLILTGATGFVGGEVLSQALKDPDIERVTVFTRRALPLQHPKLHQIELADFTDWSGVAADDLRADAEAGGDDDAGAEHRLAAEYRNELVQPDEAEVAAGRDVDTPMGPYVVRVVGRDRDEVEDGSGRGLNRVGVEVCLEVWVEHGLIIPDERPAHKRTSGPSRC